MIVGIQSRGKTKLYHINMLKKYVRHEKECAAKQSVCPVCIVEDTESPGDVCDVAVVEMATGSKININPELSAK